MKKVALAKVKDHLSSYLREAGKEQIVITRHGKPAGVLIGFESEDDWFEYRLENDPRFLKRIEKARASIRAGKGIPLDEVEAEDDKETKPSRARRKRRG
ncbi:MAG: type II toxin-antitoxin system Phd/YefM family antitoxin [Planctomycetota bacterium]